MTRSSRARIIRRQIAEAPPVIESPQQRHDRVVAELMGVIRKEPARIAGEELAIIAESFLVRIGYIAIKAGGDDAILDAMVQRVKMRLVAIRIRELSQAKPEGTS